MGFGANGGFDFTKELKEKLRKNMGFGRPKEGVWSQRWIWMYKGKERLIVKNYKKQVATPIYVNRLELIINKLLIKTNKSFWLLFKLLFKLLFELLFKLLFELLLKL